MRKPILMLFTIATLGVALSCSNGIGPNGQQIYVIEQSVVCFCPPEMFTPIRLTVADGRIAAGFNPETGEMLSRERLRVYKSIEQLHDFIQTAKDRDAVEINVHYDPELGYPRWVWVDWIAELMDEEIGYRTELVADFRQ